MAEDMEAVLLGIVYGDDERITPSDRLRAAEVLERIGGEVEPSIRSVVRAMPDEEIAAEWDALFACEVELLGGKAADMPLTAAALRVLVQERAHELAREIVDAGRVEREVEERARELAEVYAREPVARERARELPVVEQRPEVERELPAAPAPLALPPGITEEQLRRQWPGNRPRDWRRWPRE